MELFEAIRSRRSIRRFRDEDIPEEDLKKILEAAIWAPSAGNLQPWEFIVVKNEETKRRLAMAALGQMWMTTAPVIIVVCANLEKSAWRYGTRGRELYAIQDTAAAIENMLLAAHALGYGSCWVGAFDEDEVRRILNIPEGVRPVALIPIGRPAERPSPPSRIPLDRVVYGEEYGKRYFK
ncbi:MAG: nitroreductase family protein [Thermoprotei archaeon]|nr:MAG: nitroreductase family protein [Thermoprotei archaeon]